MSINRPSYRLMFGVLLLVVVCGLVLTQRTALSLIEPESPDNPETSARVNFSDTLIATGGPTAAAQTSALAATVNGGFAMQPFPHLALYGSANSPGWPFVGSTAKLGTCANNPAVACSVNTDCGSNTITCNNSAMSPVAGTALNSTVLDAYAKFPMVILPITPLADGRTDIIPALRARNPNQLIFGYAVGHLTWCPLDGNGNNSYPVGYYYRDYYLGVTGGDPSCSASTNRKLWNQAGAQWGPANVNLAYREQQPDLTYRYPVAEALAEVMYNYSKPAKGFDGLFIDIFCSGVLWAETSGDVIDYARAGYGSDNANPANRSAFDQGWLSGHERLSNHLRELAIADGQPDYPISANCGQSISSEMPVLNGWMRENYPYQNGGTFNSNVLSYPSGFLHQDYLFRAPQYNHIFTGANPSATPYTLANQQKMRFGLGSTTLGNGYHSFEDGAATPTIADYEFWWFDEWGVNTAVSSLDPNYGQAMNGKQYSGWLGQPRGPMYNYILPNGNPELLVTNTFEADVSRVHLATSNGAQAILERQTTAAPVGVGNLHVRIDQLGTTPTSVLVNSDVFQVTNGASYSLTFWAKATKTRGMAVAIDGAGVSIPISDSWQRYQVSLQVTATGNAVYQLQLGQETGDIWFDDFRIQAGIGNVYRRDFDHGTVLVNPYSVPLTIQLEKPYKKILGTVNPSLNTGAVVSSVTLTPDVGQGIGDAIFLLDIDITVPSTVTNLQATP